MNDVSSVRGRVETPVMGGKHSADNDVLIKNLLQLLLSTVNTD
jgi:hypothetical protein